jgi:hypothetical protein
MLSRVLSPNQSCRTWCACKLLSWSFHDLLAIASRQPFSRAVLVLGSCTAGHRAARRQPPQQRLEVQLSTSCALVDGSSSGLQRSCKCTLSHTHPPYCCCTACNIITFATARCLMLHVQWSSLTQCRLQRPALMLLLAATAAAAAMQS